MHGNGKVRTLIRAREFAPGHVVFSIKQKPPGADTSLNMSNAGLGWSKDHPDAKITAALPIVSGGNTVLFHLWYEKRQSTRRKATGGTGMEPSRS